MLRNASQGQTPLERVLTIQSAVDVEKVLRSRQVLLDVHVVVQIPTVSLEQSLHWERELNRSFQECGCLHGTVCTAMTLVGATVWYIFHLSLWHSFILWAPVALLLAAILGKMAGLAWARLRIWRVTSEMRKLQPDVIKIPIH